MAKYTAICFLFTSPEINGKVKQVLIEMDLLEILSSNIPLQTLIEQRIKHYGMELKVEIEKTFIVTLVCP